MQPDATAKDPAFAVMAMDILSNVLSRADNPGELGTYLTEEIRELTGARCVLLIQSLCTATVTAYRVVSVNPSRRREWAESPAANRLYEVVHRIPAARFWRGGEPSEVAGLLHREGFELSMAFPLNAGAFRVGAMLVLGLPDEEHISSVLDLLNNLSAIVALVLRNSFLFERQEEIIQERTAELQIELTERKRAEEALKESEAKYMDLYENAPDMYASVNAKTALIEQCNSTLSSTLGYPKEEIIGRPVFEIYHPDCLEEVQKVFKLFRDAGEVRDKELQLRRKDSSRLDVSLNVSSVRDEEGNILYSRSTLRDITERKQAERALKFTQFAIDNSIDQAFWMGENARLIYVNDAACRTLGYSREELLQMSIPDIGPNYPAEVFAEHWRELKEKGSITFESLHRAKDGRIYPVEIRANFVEFDGKEYNCAFATDISERKRAEEALEKRLVALTRPLDDAAGVTFEELFNLTDIQRLQEGFAQATGVASLITLPDGTPLTEPSNYCRLCGIIRATEKGAANCMKSDAALGQPSCSGPTIKQCLSAGLWGAGAAIAFGGRHIANWLIGQVRDESIAEEQMRAYARKVGADEEAVVEAFSEVPVMSGEKFGQVAQALYTLARQLSSIAYQNVQQARFITERKQAEEALRESEREYRSIVEHAPFGITRSTKDGKLVSVNPALASILKYDSAQELMETINRSSIQDVLFPKPSEREPLVENILASDAWHVFNNRLRCKDGSIVTCRVYSRRIVDEAGQPSEFDSFQENITDQVEAEQALRESEEKFRVLAETSPVAICLYQGERLIYANPAMERLFGYSADKLCRMKFWDWAREDFKELIRERGLARLKGEAVPGQYEASYITKAGDERVMLVSAGTIDYQGRATGVASFLDITERKRTEELIRASLREKEVLLKEIHHRVKNNLQVVSSLLFLQAQKIRDPEIAALFSESQNRIHSMALAHEQLYQSKNLADVRLPEYVGSLIEEIMQVFRSGEKTVRCQVDVDDVDLDIEQVVPCGLLITELLSNALRHAFPGPRTGTVSVEMHRRKGMLSLTVRDDGVGLPADLDVAATRTLGLQLVRALTAQLDGTLEVARREGAEFRVTFPVRNRRELVGP